MGSPPPKSINVARWRHPRTLAWASADSTPNVVPMGRSGIRARKPRHHLPKVEEDISPEDVNRLFGRFRWGSYSPAGTLERNGFFWRQVNRVRRDSHQSTRTRRAAAAARWYVVALFLGLSALALCAALLRHL